MDDHAGESGEHSGTAKAADGGWEMSELGLGKSQSGVGVAWEDSCVIQRVLVAERACTLIAVYHSTIDGLRFSDARDGEDAVEEALICVRLRFWC